MVDEAQLEVVSKVSRESVPEVGQEVAGEAKGIVAGPEAV